MNSSNWEIVSLGHLLNFRRGHDLPKTKMIDGNVPVVGSNGIIGMHSEYTTKSPCLTIGRSGNIGKPKYVDKNCWAHNTTLYVDDFKGNNPEYLYYLLESLNLKNYGGGSAVPTLNRNHIHPIEVKATLNTKEQKAIVTILSALDKKIEVNNRINKTLENMAQEIFKRWFIDFEFPNEDGDPYKYNDGQMEETEIGWIPKGWGIKPLYDMALYINGTSFKKSEIGKNSGVPIVKIAEMKNGYSSSTNYLLDGYQKDEKYYLKSKDILFSWSGNPETSIDIFIWGENEGVLNQHIFKVVPENYGNSYIYFLLKSYKNIFTQIASNKQTTGLGHVTIRDLKNLKLAVPPEKILEKFTMVSDYVFDEMHLIIVENQNLLNIRDILLPKLMSGEIRVSIE